jgi:hypothetical protein
MRQSNKMNINIDFYNETFKRTDGTKAMEQHALINVNNCLNTNIYSYLVTSGDQCLNVVHFFNTSIK